MFNLPPGKYLIGKEYSTGKPIVITVMDGPRCGIECDCCEYDDGTAPSDHDRTCGIIRGGWDCTCEGADERARDRKRVRLVIGRCPIDKALEDKVLRKEDDNG